MNKPKAVFCWSGGKDSSLCLHKVLAENKYEITYLLTTVNGHNKRVSMHGIHESLLEAQADSIGIELIKVYVYEGNNSEYEKNMEETLSTLKTKGINHVIFGDIFLEDLRTYRENNLKKVGMEAVFPLWKKDTKELMREFLALNFKTVLCCINDAYLDESYAGRLITDELITSFPADVDVCGENGEYHTFCYEGPIFKKALKIKTGKIIYMPLPQEQLEMCVSPAKKITKGFWYADILLK